MDLLLTFALSECVFSLWTSELRDESNGALGGLLPGNCDEIWRPLLIKIV